MKRTTKRTTFDAGLFQEAWNWLWADNLQTRAAGRDFDGQSYYLTATDLENQVRSFLLEDLEGKPRGSRGRGSYAGGSWGSGLRVGGFGPGGLFGACRTWLMRNSKLTAHNFGRGHCSGERFRPVGQPLSPQEERSLDVKAKREKQRKEGTAPVHFSDPLVKSWPSKTLCSRAARKTARAKSGGYGGWRRGRSTCRLTDKACDVTCPRCQALIREAAELSPEAPMAAVHDKLEEAQLVP